MPKDLAEIKKEFDAQIENLKGERKIAIMKYKEKIREMKIEKIRNSILKK